MLFLLHGWQSRKALAVGGGREQVKNLDRATIRKENWDLFSCQGAEERRSLMHGGMKQREEE